MFKTFTGALALAAWMCGSASAHEYQVGSIVIQHPYAYETAVTAKAAGGFMTIKNQGTEDDRLLRVDADFPRVMLHNTEETDGVARMLHVDHLDVPAGGTAVLEPGGLHVMFMGLDGNPFISGEEVTATLVFEKSGSVAVTLKIQPR